MTIDKNRKRKGKNVCNFDEIILCNCHDKRKMRGDDIQLEKFIRK